MRVWDLGSLLVSCLGFGNSSFSYDSFVNAVPDHDHGHLSASMPKYQHDRALMKYSFALAAVHVSRAIHSNSHFFDLGVSEN